jgi:uncharacterized protein (TIGR02145 family)
MQKVVYFILVSLLLFVSCKKDASDSIDTKPTLATPKDNATNIAAPVVLTWNESSGATSYTLQVSASSSFTSPVFNKSYITATPKQITGLSLVTKYYWRVSAANNYGTKGWSATWSFTTSTFSCGTSTVDYSGKTYNTVQVGIQCWLKENLDVGTMIQGNADPGNNGTIEKYCYDNNSANCTTYGGLYQWNEAMQYVTTEKAKGICPTGWHIPTQAAFQALVAAVGGGNKLKREDQGTGSGVGTNTSGFSGLLAGTRYGTGLFGSLGYYHDSGFWSSTEDFPGYATTLYLAGDGSDVYLQNEGKGFAYSIRCLKD